MSCLTVGPSFSDSEEDGKVEHEEEKHLSFGVVISVHNDNREDYLAQEHYQQHESRAVKPTILELELFSHLSKDSHGLFELIQNIVSFLLELVKAFTLSIESKVIGRPFDLVLEHFVADDHFCCSERLMLFTCDQIYVVQDVLVLIIEFSLNPSTLSSPILLDVHVDHRDRDEYHQQEHNKGLADVKYCAELTELLSVFMLHEDAHHDHSDISPQQVDNLVVVVSLPPLAKLRLMLFR